MQEALTVLCMYSYPNILNPHTYCSHACHTIQSHATICVGHVLYEDSSYFYNLAWSESDM